MYSSELGRKILAPILTAAVGLTGLAACGDTKEQAIRADCVVVQPTSIGAIALTGPRGVFPMTLETGYGIPYPNYQANFTGDDETRAAIKAKLNNKELGSDDVLAFCVTFVDQNDLRKGGHFWPYTRPDNGPIDTTPVQKAGGEPPFLKVAEAKYSGTKVFKVTDDQTALEPVRV